MTREPLKYFSKEKALDLATWLNFEHRLKNDRFGAIRSHDGQYLVVPTDHPTFDSSAFETLPESYKKMSYSHIQSIWMDHNSLQFWEAIQGMVSTVDGETLRFVLKYQVPLQRLIRFELAARGYDANNRWCGFKTAKEIWLK